jgi:hypothetical protein
MIGPNWHLDQSGSSYNLIGQYGRSFNLIGIWVNPEVATT